MNKRLVTRAALTLLAIASSIPMAHGGGWYGGGYYGGWHGYHGGWRGAYWGPGVGFYIGGPTYWGGWPYAYNYPYGYGYAPYAPYTSYAVADPTVYVERQIDVSAPPARSNPSPPSAQGNPAPPPTFWFYCTKPAGYYPYVQNCSKTWLPVVPQANTGTRTRPKLAQ
jgi:hypothetical protein